MRQLRETWKKFVYQRFLIYAILLNGIHYEYMLIGKKYKRQKHKSQKNVDLVQNIVDPMCTFLPRYWIDNL